MTAKTPQDAVLNLRTPRPLRERITRRASERGVRLSDVARDALALGLDMIETMERRNVAA